MEMVQKYIKNTWCASIQFMHHYILCLVYSSFFEKQEHFLFPSCDFLLSIRKYRFIFIQITSVGRHHSLKYE